MRALSFLLILIASAAFAVAQPSIAPIDKKAEKEAKKKERERVEQVLTAYTKCTFPDGLKISRVDRIAKNEKEELTRDVANGDLKPISRTDSYRVMVDYGVPDYFANIRPDRSDPSRYAEDKEILIRWLTHLNTLGRSMDARFPKETYRNGFEAYQINRAEVAGNSMGTALLFDDQNSIVTTIYFLNQREQYRKFKTVEEWRDLSDRFLNTYTGCVRENLSAGTGQK